MKVKPGAHISVSNVDYMYRRGTRLALKNISSEIEPCETVALVGRSGCGKSTLLHLMSGLLSPSAGEIRIDGALVERPSPSWVVMFQQPSLYPWMSVERNVGIGLKFAGKPKAEIKARVRDLLKLVELDGFAERNAQELSGGQQQRVALARSLAVNPEVLFLDEPFSALDSVTRRAMQRDVSRIATEIGITLVIVTHDISEAVAMADRALVMSSEPGRICETVPVALESRERENPHERARLVEESLAEAFERAVRRSAKSGVNWEEKVAAPAVAGVDP